MYFLISSTPTGSVLVELPVFISEGWTGIKFQEREHTRGLQGRSCLAVSRHCGAACLGIPPLYNFNFYTLLGLGPS